MSLVGKNRKLFSYKNEDRKQRHYMYKDFEKTKSYKTDFSYSSFTGVSLRAAQMKYCNFNHVCFSGVDFIGTNLCGSTFKGASFSDCIFSSTKLKHTSFTDSVFQNCYFIGIGIASAKGLYRDTEGITFLDRMPSQDSIPLEVTKAAEQLRSNDIIRRSHTLHCKKGKINTISIMILQKTYTDEQLSTLLPLLPEHVGTQFYSCAVKSEPAAGSVLSESICPGSPDFSVIRLE